MSKQYTLHKGQRLKSRKKIELLFKEGNSFLNFPFKVYWLVEEKQSAGVGLQFGIGVGTRNFKKAVDRNRIKRICREAYRLQRLQLEEKLLASNKKMSLFLIYVGKEIPESELIKEKTSGLMRKLVKVVDEVITPNT